jgi:hypothetical protein
VRVDKGTLVYGDEVFYRNDPVIMTVARTDDQTFGTIQSIGATEVSLSRFHGDYVAYSAFFSQECYKIYSEPRNTAGSR